MEPFLIPLYSTPWAGCLSSRRCAWRLGLSLSINWIYEVNFDGFRSLAYIEGVGCRLESHRRREYNHSARGKVRLGEIHPCARLRADLLWEEIRDDADHSDCGSMGRDSRS